MEHAYQLELLKALGCRQAQSYFLSTPRPAGEVDALLGPGRGLPLISVASG